jgi:hypothetical protein
MLRSWITAIAFGAGVDADASADGACVGSAIAELELQPASASAAAAMTKLPVRVIVEMSPSRPLLGVALIRALRSRLSTPGAPLTVLRLGLPIFHWGLSGGVSALT